jgi:hypothetical protein
MPLHDWTRVDPNDYHHFHGRWIYALADVLNGGRLPPGYYAMAEHSTPPVVPDVLTLEVPAADGSRAASGGTATATAPPKVRFTASGRRRTRARPARRRVAVRHARGRHLVAVIEVVSPSNKSDRHQFREFLDKLVAFLDQGIHLLVIDPFPPTRRDPAGLHAAVWKALVKGTFTPPADKPLTLVSYAALGADEFAAYVEPVAVRDRLAEMPLFLTPERYVKVPLESTYRTAWDGFPKPLRPLVEDRA